MIQINVKEMPVVASNCPFSKKDELYGYRCTLNDCLSCQLARDNAAPEHYSCPFLCGPTIDKLANE